MLFCCCEEFTHLHFDVYLPSPSGLYNDACCDTCAFLSLCEILCILYVLPLLGCTSLMSVIRIKVKVVNNVLNLLQLVFLIVSVSFKSEVCKWFMICSQFDHVM